MRMRATLAAAVVLSICCLDAARGGENADASGGPRRLNNLVSDLLHVAEISESASEFLFTRATAGWIFVSARCTGTGTASIAVDKSSGGESIIVHEAGGADVHEAVRFVGQGGH